MASLYHKRRCFCLQAELSWTKVQLSVETAGLQTKYVFTFNYLTTAAQERYIDENTTKIVADLNINDLNDYEKIKAVNDYIIKKVCFDNSYRRKSAYDALYSGKTICRGYALLAYKMLNEASVPVRIVTGTADGQAHAWNIVELDEKWYNLDMTWDDFTRSDAFFLKSDKDLSLHTKDSEFSSDSFLNKYPLANESYQDSIE